MQPQARILVLAAGFSRRFGSDKRQAATVPVDPDSPPLLLATLRRLAQLHWAMTLVLRGDDQAFATELTRDPDLASVDCVFAVDSARGMGHSLAAGAQRLQRQGTSQLLVALGDMPFIQLATLRTLAAATLALEPTRPGVVRARYAGQAGHPVGLSGAALPELGELSGDEGARRLLRRWSAKTLWLTVDDPGILRDVDRPADLA